MKKLIIFLTISTVLLCGCQKKESSYNIELLAYHWRPAIQIKNDSIINRSTIYLCPLYVKVDSSHMTWVCVVDNGEYYFSHYKLNETLFNEFINEISKIPRDTTFRHLINKMDQPRIYDGPWIRLLIRKDGNIKNILITDPEQLKGTALLKFYRSFVKVEQFDFANHSKNDSLSILKSRQIFINSISNTETDCLTPKIRTECIE